MAQKDEVKTPAEKKGSGSGKLLIILIGGLMLVGGSVGATLFLTGALKPHTDAESAAASGPPAHSMPAARGTAQMVPALSRQPPIYQPLDPPFIVNFEDQGLLRYLQVGMSVMARDKLAIDAVNNNMPQIRNNLIMLLANQKLEVLTSSDGKEKLRGQALEHIQAVLNREIGQPGIESVYFTAFVMQ